MWQINCFTRSYRSECRLCQCAKVATKKLDVFISVLLGDMQEIYSETDSDGTTSEEDEDETSNVEVEWCHGATFKNNRIMSTAQDIIYSISGGKKWIIKHIDLCFNSASE